MSNERDNMEFSNDPRSGAGSPEANGHNGHATEVSPYDTPEVREKRRKRKETEQAAASASAATVVSGRYAADACTGLSAAGRECLSSWRR